MVIEIDTAKALFQCVPSPLPLRTLFTKRGFNDDNDDNENSLHSTAICSYYFVVLTSHSYSLAIS